jgi:hypothetical protein
LGRVKASEGFGAGEMEEEGQEGVRTWDEDKGQAYSRRWKEGSR